MFSHSIAGETPQKLSRDRDDLRSDAAKARAQRRPEVQGTAQEPGKADLSRNSHGERLLRLSL